MSAELINKLFEVVVKKFEGLIEERKTNNKVCSFEEMVLPIKKIDGLNVCVKFEFKIHSNDNTFYMFIEINPSKIYYKDEKRLYFLSNFSSAVYDEVDNTYNYNVFKLLIERFFNDLPKLKLNIEGKFTINGEIQCSNSEYKYITLFIDEKIDGVEFVECEECCVCREHTTTKTICRHILCLKCEDKINEMSKGRKPKCPICRQCIENYNDSDEEEEEEDDDE
jgi:hypothetical protein